MRKSLPFGEPDSEAVRTSPPRARDWVAAGLVAVLSVTEVLIRDDMAWRPLALAVGLILSWAIMWRRRQPLLVLVVAFSTFAIIGVFSVVVLGVPFSFYAGSFVLVLVYALLRRASTTHAALGMAVVLLVWAVSIVTDVVGTEDAVGGVLALLLAAALGLTVRYRAVIRAQQFDRVRANERECLARELHDTVAHHVSAIAIQAQAGRLLIASHDVEAAGDALRVIEVEQRGALESLSESVQAMLYRVAR